MTRTITSPFIDAAAALRARGFAIVWLRPGEKRPRRRGWNGSSQEPGDYRPGDNLGLLCGRLSEDLVCVDLDAPGAAGQAGAILPATGMIDGRPGKPDGPLVVPGDGRAPRAAGPTGRGRGDRRAEDRPTSRTRAAGRSVLEFKGTGPAGRGPALALDRGGRARRRVSGTGRTARPVPAPGEPAIVDCRELFDAGPRAGREPGRAPRSPGRGPDGPAGSPGRPTRTGRDPGPGSTARTADRRRPAAPPASPIGSTSPGSSRSGCPRRGAATAGTRPRTAWPARLVNDCALPREPALGLLREYNGRLGREGQETWTEAELAHKVDSALAAAADPRFPYGVQGPGRAGDEPAPARPRVPGRAAGALLAGPVLGVRRHEVHPGRRQGDEGAA